MKKIAFNILCLGLVFFSVVGLTYWKEAEKEIHVLQSMIHENQSLESVLDLLNTAELSMYKIGENEVILTSSIMLNTLVVTIPLEDDRVDQAPIIHETINLSVIARSGAILLTAGLLLFQFYLAIGMPWGEWAWGGFHRTLPRSLRRASALSSVILCLPFIILVLSSTEAVLPHKAAIYAIVPFLILFFFSILGNLASVSKKEKWVMIPVSIMLFLSYFVVVYSNV